MRTYAPAFALTLLAVTASAQNTAALSQAEASALPTPPAATDKNSLCRALKDGYGHTIPCFNMVVHAGTEDRYGDIVAARTINNLALRIAIDLNNPNITDLNLTELIRELTAKSNQLCDRYDCNPDGSYKHGKKKHWWNKALSNSSAFH